MKTTLNFTLNFTLKFTMLGLLCLSASYAFDFGQGLIPPSKQKNTFRYTGVIDAELLQTNLNAFVPVVRSDSSVLGMTSQYKLVSVFADDVPYSHLYDIQIGASYSHSFTEEKGGSLSVTLGSASDRPFKSSEETTVSATATYSFVQSETEKWVLLVNYSNNRPVLNNIPLPGFAYIYTPNKNFRGTFGIPFASIYWQFIDRWSFSLFTVAPWVAKAQVGYALIGPVQLFSGVDFSQMTFLIHGRTHSKERFYFDEKKAFIGGRSPLSKILFSEIETGYAFDREFFFAESYEINPDNPIKINASWYGKISLSAQF